MIINPFSWCGHLALVTFSTARVSTRSDVAALFVRCGRSESSRGRIADRGRWNAQLHIRGDIRGVHRSDRSSIAKPPTAMQRPPRRVTSDLSLQLHRRRVVGRAVGNLISSRLCALRSKCNCHRQRSCSLCAVFSRDTRKERGKKRKKRRKKNTPRRRKNAVHREFFSKSSFPILLPFSSSLHYRSNLNTETQILDKFSRKYSDAFSPLIVD